VSARLSRHGTRLVVLFSVLLSCRRAPGSDLSVKVSPSREFLRRADIGSRYVNALEAVVHLRPEYLSAAVSSVGPSASREPVVYVDGNRLANLEGLRGVPVSWIVEIRYVRGFVAGARYGGDHAAGALFITTTRRGVEVHDAALPRAPDRDPAEPRANQFQSSTIRL